MMTRVFLTASALLSFGAVFLLSANRVVLTSPADSPASPSSASVIIRSDGDLPDQPPLSNPPANIRALYVTNWVAGTPSLFNNIIDQTRGTDINALVIDVKDYSGYLGWNADLKIAHNYNAVAPRVPQLNRLIKQVHDAGLYFIARVTVFQDPRLALARPELAVKDATGAVWRDRHNLAWLDPAAREVWDYHIAIARELTRRGVDEVNFDYIRFPTDGAGVSDLIFPFWDGLNRRDTLRSFFSYLRSELSSTTISADIFGQTSVDNGDLGIGQIIEDAYDYFDYVSPMIYPSHFHPGFIGFTNPAAYPYEVVSYTMKTALSKLIRHETDKQMAALATTTPPSLSSADRDAIRRKLRPWLQDFDLGATYSVKMVKDQIQAVNDAGLNNSWLIWNPRNVYRSGLFSTSTPSSF